METEAAMKDGSEEMRKPQSGRRLAAPQKGKVTLVGARVTYVCASLAAGI